MQQIAADKAINLVHQGESDKDEDFMKLSIEELIKMNQGEDIDVEFYFNGKRIELNTSFFEIIKDEDQVKGGKAKATADHIRDVLANLQNSGQGFALPNYHTIYFLIKDKPKMVA